MRLLVRWKLIRELKSSRHRSQECSTIGLHIYGSLLWKSGNRPGLWLKLGRKTFPCSRCGNLTEIDPCWICTDPQRDESIICVVEQASDVMAVERANYQGKYYVLNQNPRLMDSGSLEELNLQGLLNFIKGGRVQEIILATNPTIDGELTARYIARVVKSFGVRITRLAHGLPVGGDLEYTDELTLRRALEGRREI